MTAKNPTVRERLAVVETEMSYVKDELTEFGTKMDFHTEAIQSLNACVEKKLRGSLSSKEKAQIFIAMIASIGAILVAVISNLGPLFV